MPKVVDTLRPAPPPRLTPLKPEPQPARVEPETNPARKPGDLAFAKPADTKPLSRLEQLRKEQAEKEGTKP